MKLRHLTAFTILPFLLACGVAEDGTAQDIPPEARQVAQGDDWETDFTKHSVPFSEIIHGGPPKDGIPSIDNPKFDTPAGGDEWLDDREQVMVVEVDGDVRAYPLSILIAHEIVNDEIGGMPVTVTYCPLCNTALSFDRRVEGKVLDFGTTGRLRHSDLVMYDRQTESWWQQASGEAIVGDFTGTFLDFVPSTILSWGKARELHPDLRVLSPDTGFRRNYGQNPYAGYDQLDRQPMGAFLTEDPDPRLPPMERVAGVKIGDGWAVTFSVLAEERVVNARVEDVDLVVFWESGAASPLDARRTDEGRDVGMTAVFDRTVDGETLTFEWDGEAFRDQQTGSTWNLAGKAVDGQLEGTRLETILHGNHFWFAWSIFEPDAELYEG